MAVDPKTLDFSPLSEFLVGTCFQRAIEIARKQNTKSYELRATMSLARLFRDTGRRDEARMMLADIYGWFTEGFDTPRPQRRQSPAG